MRVGFNVISDKHLDKKQVDYSANIVLGGIGFVQRNG